MLSPLAKISELIAELEGTRPKPFGVHLRKLRIVAGIAYRRAAWQVIGFLAVTGGTILALGIFELENQAVPLLTGLFQIAVAAILAWDQFHFELGD